MLTKYISIHRTLNPIITPMLAPTHSSEHISCYRMPLKHSTLGLYNALTHQYMTIMVAIAHPSGQKTRKSHSKHVNHIKVSLGDKNFF